VCVFIFYRAELTVDWQAIVHIWIEHKITHHKMLVGSLPFFWLLVEFFYC